MKNQTFRMTMLFDFYGELLTERQKEFYELYYDEDLSLSADELRRLNDRRYEDSRIAELVTVIEQETAALKE